MTIAVQAVALSKTYRSGPGRVVALDDVSLSLASGTVAALLGPSGSGKSTLVKALGFVSPADRGEVLFQGRSVVKDGIARTDLSRLRREHLGFVFQKANLTSFLTARENVEIACELGGKPAGRERARELLRYLDVLHRQDAYPEMLSRRRATTRSHRAGTRAAVLVVTHDHRALDVFDVLYEMEDGRILPRASPATLDAASPTLGAASE